MLHRGRRDQRTPTTHRRYGYSHLLHSHVSTAPSPSPHKAGPCRQPAAFPNLPTSRTLNSAIPLEHDRNTARRTVDDIGQELACAGRIESGIYADGPKSTSNEREEQTCASTPFALLPTPSSPHFLVDSSCGLEPSGRLTPRDRTGCVRSCRHSTYFEYLLGMITLGETAKKPELGLPALHFYLYMLSKGSIRMSFVHRYRPHTRQVPRPGFLARRTPINSYFKLSALISARSIRAKVCHSPKS